MREKALRDQAQRIRVPGMGRNLRNGFPGDVFRLTHRLDGSLERLAHDGSELPRQAGVQDELALHVEEGRDPSKLVLPLREARRVALLRPVILADELLDVRGRAVAPDV